MKARAVNLGARMEWGALIVPDAPAKWAVAPASAANVADAEGLKVVLRADLRDEAGNARIVDPAKAAFRRAS